MTNLQQNEIENEIEQFNKDINLLQDKLKKLKNEKRQISKMKMDQRKSQKIIKCIRKKSKLKGR